MTLLSGLFIVLAVLWAVFLFGGFIFGKLDEARTRRMPAWTRMASSFTLVILAWAAFIVAANDAGERAVLLILATGPDISRFTMLTAMGMTLGFVGDLFMAHLIHVKQPEMGGIASFGLGHVAYIAAFVGIGDELRLNAPGIRLGALVVWLIIGAVGWYIAVFRGQNPTPLHIAALPYALLLSTTTAFATALALQYSAFIPLAVGCALFLLSDLILAAHLFRGAHFYLMDDVVWLTYGPAQMLIVSTSVLLALHTLPIY